MNTKLGWLRAWVVLSAMWVIPCAVFGLAIVTTEIKDYRLPSAGAFFTWLAITAFPPAFLYALGLSIAWVIRGFKGDGEPK
ncbi:MAG: hypothetical protein A3G41_05860 [Elusimicrobia bacterium RIFCSPLOWO2_12_FULL_59_9]|nr:MAG: hypothetical protein A3G41_05860 [Elusimicrobia bacterium RIFCSPLOWO2_12_FULL_59_9]